MSDVTRLRAWDLSPWKEEIWESAVERFVGGADDESRTAVGMWWGCRRCFGGGSGCGRHVKGLLTGEVKADEEQCEKGRGSAVTKQ